MIQVGKDIMRTQTITRTYTAEDMKYQGQYLRRYSDIACNRISKVLIQRTIVTRFY